MQGVKVMANNDKEFNQIKYQNEYNKKNYDRFQFMAPKGTKEVIKEAASSAGQSVSEYILQAIRDRLERDQNS